MARVLEERLLWIVRQSHGKRPGPDPGLRVIHRDRPLEPARSNGLEPLDEDQVRGRVPISRARIEVGRLDHQRIAFPMPSRVAHVRPQVGSRAVVERDDARLVNHLVPDGDQTRRLRDVVGVPVNRRHHRARQSAGDAAIVEAAVRIRIGAASFPGSACSASTASAAAAQSLLGGRRLRRNRALRRIDDQPGAAVLGAVVLVPVNRARPGVPAANPPGRLEAVRVSRLGELRQLGIVDLPELFPGQIPRTLEGDAVLVLVAIAALDVRVAPRCLGWDVRLGGRRGARRGTSLTGLRP